MSFDTIYVMQAVLLISMVFSLIAYAAMVRADGMEHLIYKLQPEAACRIAKQYERKLNMEDRTSFEKYGIWRYSGRFWRS